MPLLHPLRDLARFALGVTVDPVLIAVNGVQRYPATAAA